MRKLWMVIVAAAAIVLSVSVDAQVPAGCAPNALNIPGAPFGSAASLDDAKAAFKTPSRAFKEKLGPDKLATAYAVMNKRP